MHMQDDRFVPETSLSSVDNAWEALKKTNPKYFDGEILHVLTVNRTGCGGATLQVAPSSYRFHAVGGLGIHPLGVKGICLHEGKYLCGLRGAQSGVYPNEWEFAPAGTVEPMQSPEDVIERELEEETGMYLKAPPIPIGLFLDEYTQSWELVYELSVEGEPEADGDEYESLAWCDVKTLPKPLSHAAQLMRTLL